MQCQFICSNCSVNFYHASFHLALFGVKIFGNKSVQKTWHWHIVSRKSFAELPAEQLTVTVCVTNSCMISSTSSERIWQQCPVLYQTLILQLVASDIHERADKTKPETGWQNSPKKRNTFVLFARLTSKSFVTKTWAQSLGFFWIFNFYSILQRSHRFFLVSIQPMVKPLIYYPLHLDDNLV